MRRAAVSIPSNIAEGRRRGSKKDFRSFLINAYGSGAELETQLLLIKKLFKINEGKYLEVNQLLEEIMKMLNKMTAVLKEKQ